MSLATQPSSSEVYTARRSQHVTTDLAASDGTVWEEKLAVCEGVQNGGEPQLLIRSFYRNMATGERLWDEPPSGAGSVVHASADDRKKAEEQRNDLQATLAMIPQDAQPSPTPEPAVKKEKKGLFGRFRRKKESNKKQVETSKDINLQRAIARSIAEQTYTGAEDQIALFPGLSPQTGGGDDDIELAKALSMSVMENSGGPSEEELFQRALEKSQRENQHSDGLGVASMPTHTEDLSWSSNHQDTEESFKGGKTPEDFELDDRKPPPS